MLLSSPTSWAEFSRCEKLRAEAAELEKFSPRACEESRETHQTYLKSFSRVQEICKQLEARVAVGAPQLTPGTEDEMTGQIMELKQKHINERQELSEKITLQLLPTPLDNNDPSRLLPTVSSECGSEVEAYARYRRNVLRGLSEFFAKIDEYDNSLFGQAQQKALPGRPTAASKKGR